MPTQTPSSAILRLLARAQGAQFNCWRVLLSEETDCDRPVQNMDGGATALADLIFDLAEELKKCAK
jgi:hypothetical protein